MKTITTRIKICGVKSVDDALLAAEAGADAVGMILHAPGRSREIPLDLGHEIAMALPPFVTAVGVAVDLHPMRLRQLLSHVPVSLVQFHGDESKTDVLSAQPTRATKVVPGDASLGESIAKWQAANVWNLCGLVIDAPAGGGKGAPPDWDVVADALDSIDNLPPLTLAGGLTPENVGDVIRRFRPWAVDVSSGVEDPGNVGVKSPSRVAEFIAAVREADAA